MTETAAAGYQAQQQQGLARLQPLLQAITDQTAGQWRASRVSLDSESEYAERR
jgi:hypothetical protein